ncbi:MAG: hypothetical protein HYZ45_04850 [Burkholderiales bacterium]|nr:hypothetical protein [Burkholderiales bacterium]
MSTMYETQKQGQSGLGWWQKYGFALGISLCAALPFFNGFSWLSFLSFLAVTVLSFFFAYQTQAKLVAYDPSSASPEREEQEGEQNLQLLLAAVLPVWRRHVESIKSQTEGSVEQLITSFSSMVKQFDMAGFGGVSGREAAGHEDMTISLLTLCERELSPVISVLEKVIGSKDELLGANR